ncbi:MAG: tyrosine-protein kinase family protein [Planctomycetota bacterium]|jgi:Mrp family chromosome partitioning ATPase
MTTTDRAFIRVFGQDEPAPTATLRDPARPIIPFPESAGTVSDGAQPPAAEEPAKPSISLAADTSPSIDPNSAAPSEATEPAVEEESADAEPGQFRPALQVDAFAWPSRSERLGREAADEVDRLADALVTGLSQGQKTVGLTSCRRGDGCTTLVMCVARRLAERGLKVAMVDADFCNPLLAQRLGLLPESGWEKVLCHGWPVSEVLIESVGDRLVVLPLGGPHTCPSCEGGHDCASAGGLHELAEHYDLVLVDLGEAEETLARGEEPSQGDLDWIDAAVLVHNVRSTGQADLNRVRSQLKAAGLAEAGIVENFADVPSLA